MKPNEVIANTKEWDRIRKMATATEMRVKVGVLAEHGGAAMVPQEEGAESRPITYLELAAIHEFGSPAANIPERSFIRRTFIDRKADLNKVTEAIFKKYVKGLPLEQALGLLGTWAVAQIKNTIKAGVTPDIKEATKRRKKSTKPLVDTGRMINALSYLVEKVT